MDLFYWIPQQPRRSTSLQKNKLTLNDGWFCKVNSGIAAILLSLLGSRTTHGEKWSDNEISTKGQSWTARTVFATDVGDETLSQCTAVKLTEDFRDWICHAGKLAHMFHWALMRIKCPSLTLWSSTGPDTVVIGPLRLVGASNTSWTWCYKMPVKQSASIYISMFRCLWPCAFNCTILSTKKVFT